MKERKLGVLRLRGAKFWTKIEPVIGAVAGLNARRFIGAVPPFAFVGDITLGIASGVVGSTGFACSVSAPEPPMMQQGGRGPSQVGPPP
jgi:hypothetical protein